MNVLGNPSIASKYLAMNSSAQQAKGKTDTSSPDSAEPKDHFKPLETIGNVAKGTLGGALIGGMFGLAGPAGITNILVRDMPEVVQLGALALSLGIGVVAAPFGFALGATLGAVTGLAGGSVWAGWPT